MAGAGDPDDVGVDGVINNHNYRRYVVAAVESALAQSYPRVRVIVVDDGSTDDSREVLLDYQGRVELVFKPNGGQASALNAGFARCSGNVVIFLDADDVLAPGAAAAVAGAFAHDPHLVKVQYRMEVIDDAGARTGALKPERHLALPQGDVSRAELTFPFDLVWLATSANAFSAAALRRLLPLPETEFGACPDWYLNHLVALLGPVASLDVVGAYYRVHGANRYEPARPALDLAHVRQTIEYAAATQRQLVRFAGELGLAPPPGGPLSVSDLANRLISLKVGPGLHPIRSDSVRQLTADGIRAALRRFDIGVTLRIAAAGWFVCAALAPSNAVPWLAEIFLFPERRARLNRVLGRLHRQPAGGGR
jgi:Glycosyl transferase family 2